MVFLISENTLDFIINYFVLIQNNFLILLLDSKITKSEFTNLFKIYKPSFVCLPSSVEMNIELKSEIINLTNHYRILKFKEDDRYINKELCLLLKTSGSTGETKFVKLTYKNIRNNVVGIIDKLKINSNHTTITTLPAEYTYGLSILNTHLYSGASIVMNKRSIIEKNFWKNVIKYKVTSFGGVPFTYEILKKIKFEKILNDKIKLKYLTQAGGKISDEMHYYLLNTLKRNKIKFFPMYGATEATSRMSILDYKFSHKIGSIGKPLKNCKFFIMKNNKRIDKPNQIGTLFFKGKNIFCGYAKKKVDLIKLSKSNILDTGDFASFDDEKFFYIKGRKKRMLKILGIRLPLDDLENQISSFINLNIKLTGNDKKLIIFSDTKNFQKKSEYLKKISKFLNINSSVLEFKFIRRFPRTVSNKIDYKALEEIK